MAYSLEGYVDVAERIRMLKAKHPEAVLRPANPQEPFKVMEIGGREFIVYTAACYRTPDDPCPAIAVAAEPAVGKTNYTRDSEVMNAETSAWGRAIMAALACESAKIASYEEVRNRQAGNDDHPSASSTQAVAKAFNGTVVPMRQAAGSAAKGSGNPASDKQKALIRSLAKDCQMSGAEVEALKIDELSSYKASSLIKELMDRKQGK